MTEEAPMPPEMATGEWAIIELFGHTTLVGRIAEVERFGAKMLALEPLFNGALLTAVFHGGAAIYRLTPVPPAVAWARQPRSAYQIPPAIRSIVPDALLTAPMAQVFEHDGTSLQDEHDEAF